MTEKLLIVLSAMAFLWNQSQSAYSAELELRQNAESKMKKVVDGIASFYAEQFHGRRTANGDRFDMNGMTCAHKYLPFGTKLLVKNAKNGKTCVVTVNDRGPYWGSRVIDLSKAAARKLGISGVGRVMCYNIGNNAKSISGQAAASPPKSNAALVAAAKPVQPKAPLLVGAAPAANHKSPAEAHALETKHQTSVASAISPAKPKASAIVAATSVAKPTAPKQKAPLSVASGSLVKHTARVLAASKTKPKASVLIATVPAPKVRNSAAMATKSTDKLAQTAMNGKTAAMASVMLATQPKAVPVAYNYSDSMNSISVDVAESPLLQFATSVH